MKVYDTRAQLNNIRAGIDIGWHKLLRKSAEAIAAELSVAGIPVVMTHKQVSSNKISVSLVGSIPANGMTTKNNVEEFLRRSKNPSVLMAIFEKHGTFDP